MKKIMTSMQLLDLMIYEMHVIMISKFILDKLSIVSGFKGYDA